MKPSRYNHFFDIEDGKKLAFNALRDSLAEIDAESWPIIEQLLANPDSATTPKELELRDQLVLGQFLIDDTMDEIAHVKVRNRRGRFGNHGLGLTVAPTLDCNFSCTYCFENRRPGHMTRETETALVAFVEKQLKTLKGFSVTWFGGEPTLCLDIIERLQHEFMETAHKAGADFAGESIVTNGFLLNHKVAQRLNAAGITRAQITLDGPEDIHDARRKLHNGLGTFQKIVDNICESAKLLKISIRVNVDRDNISRALEVADVLAKRGVLSDVNLHYGLVRDPVGSCSTKPSRCLDVEEFSQLEVDFYKTLLSMGVTNVNYPKMFGGNFCSADRDNSYVVTPTGHLYKCWEEITTDVDNCVGTIFTDDRQPHETANLYKYFSWDVFEKPACVACDILPICMANCPFRGMLESPVDRGLCTSWRYNLGEMLRLRYLSEKQKTNERTPTS